MKNNPKKSARVAKSAKKIQRSQGRSVAKKNMALTRRTGPALARAEGKKDIIGLLLQDHRPLKDLIEVLKSGNAPLARKRSAFEKFAPLLKAHAKAEEESLYVEMKGYKELRTDGFEGETEHDIADQLAGEIKATLDTDVWQAKAKVLAELVEHHIEEEEKEMFPDVRREISPESRETLGRDYLQLKVRYEPDVQSRKRSRGFLGNLLAS